MVRGRKEVDQHLLSNQKTRSHHHHHETVNWAPGPVGPILPSIHSPSRSRAVKFVDFSFFLFPFFPIFPSRGTRRTGRRRWISRFPRNEPVKLSLDEMWTKWPVCGATQASCLSPWRTSLRNFIIPFSLLCLHPPSLSLHLVYVPSPFYRRPHCTGKRLQTSTHPSHHLFVSLYFICLKNLFRIFFFFR